jgi:hypothetical protein
MHVFICWSGRRSERLARAMNDQWLPQLLGDRVSSFVSFADIERGERWFDRLLVELREADAAIVCLTPENLDSRWMHFEAGMVYGRAAVFPVFLGEATGQIADPLEAVQATASTRAAMAQLAGRLLELAGLAGSGAQQRIDAAWPALGQVIDELASPRIEDFFGGFAGLFDRKTFYEPLVDCADQSWLKRYDGARDTARALAAQRPAVAGACQPWQQWLYDKLVHQVDGYVDELRRSLIVERAFETDDRGRVDFRRDRAAPSPLPPGNPGVSCARRCREIRHIVHCLTSDGGEPVLAESLAFAKLTRDQFDDKKRIVHSRPAPVTWQSLGIEDSARRSRCERSPWDFDRIMACKARESAGGDAAAAIALVSDEIERHAAYPDGGAMTLHYAVKMLAAVLAGVAPPARAATDLRRVVDELKDILARDSDDDHPKIRRNIELIERTAGLAR